VSKIYAVYKKRFLLDFLTILLLEGACNTLLPPLPWYWLEGAHKDPQLGADLPFSRKVAFLLNTALFHYKGWKYFYRLFIR